MARKPERMGDAQAKALRDLLRGLFSDAELRRVLSSIPADLDLPGGAASKATLVHEAVDELYRHGLVDELLFSILRYLRPERSQEIEAVRALGRGLSGSRFRPTKQVARSVKALAEETLDMDKLALIQAVRPPGGEENPERVLKRALRESEGGDREGALRILLPYSVQNPTEIRVLRRIVKNCWELGMLDEAEQLALKGLSMNSIDRESRNRLHNYVGERFRERFLSSDPPSWPDAREAILNYQAAADADSKDIVSRWNIALVCREAPALCHDLDDDDRDLCWRLSTGAIIEVARLARTEEIKKDYLKGILKENADLATSPPCTNWNQKIDQIRDVASRAD